METACRKGLYKNAVGVVVVVVVGESHSSMAGFLLHKTFQYLHRTEREQKQQQKLRNTRNLGHKKHSAGWNFRSSLNLLSIF